jgi:hypothetical protein
VTLGLCIGANTAIFSVLNSVILQPLPFHGVNLLVRIFNSYPRAGIERGGASVPDYNDRLEHVPALAAVAMIQPRGVTIGVEGWPERAVAAAFRPRSSPCSASRQQWSGPSSTPRANPATSATPSSVKGCGRSTTAAGRTWWAAPSGSADVAPTIVGVITPGVVLERQDVRLWVPLAVSDEQRSDTSRHANKWGDGCLAANRDHVLLAVMCSPMNCSRICSPATAESSASLAAILAAIAARTSAAWSIRGLLPRPRWETGGGGP